MNKLLLVLLLAVLWCGSPVQAQSADENRLTSGEQAPKIDFTPYLADLQKRIKTAWFPPRGFETLIVLAVFRVHASGEMSHLQIESSSGKPKVDRAAFIAVENAQPFNPLPEGSGEWIKIRFTFVQDGCVAKVLE